MACWSYSVVHASNIQNMLEESSVYTQAHEHWFEFIPYARPLHNDREWWDPVSVGSSLQDQLNFIVKTWIATWYVSVNWLLEMKVALQRWMPIVTGSRNINWRETKKDWVAVPGTWSAHLFVITGYDNAEEVFYCMNSYWPEWWPLWGFFKLKYEDVNVLYSKYALIDKKDTEVVVARKLRKESIIEKIRDKQKDK